MAAPLVVPELLAERASSDSSLVFVNCAGETCTFARMHERAEAVAAGLAGLGVQKGDRVATILPNRIEHAELIFACARLGALHVPVNVFLKGDFLSYQLAHAAASVVVADDTGLRAVEEIRGDLPDLEHLIAVEGGLPTGERAPTVDLAPGDTMAIIYTSGTTGMPKGCMLPYGYHVEGVRSSNSLLEYGPGDVLYTALPLFHGWARGMLFAGLLHGLTLVLEPEFSVTTLLDRVKETGASVFSGVGAMGMALLATEPSYADRDHALRVAFMIPFAPDQEKAFTERFGVRVQSQMYGQTETGAVTFTPLADPGRPGTVGHPSPAYDVRVVDDDENDALMGEVVVRERHPDTLYKGYWADAEATTEAMRNGWHHTGDLARCDEDGYLTFVDRKKDALRRRGENVSSVQLEAALVAHPKIAEAAIVAVPSDMTEDDIKACLVLAPGEVTSPDELFAFFRERLPFFAIPRYVEIVDGLPKTATMRVQKHLLRRAGVTKATWDFERLGLTLTREERR
jgi:crotonobetaine/carnitine-CoA ligase